MFLVFKEKLQKFEENLNYSNFYLSYSHIKIKYTNFIKSNFDLLIKMFLFKVTLQNLKKILIIVTLIFLTINLGIFFHK